ncbi:MAG: TatD family hydrolase [Eubacteriales bacterium]
MEKLFDTHAHYYDKKFDELLGGADSLLSSEDFRATVGAVVNVGTDPENSKTVVEMAKKYDNMYAAVGIHPSDAQDRCKRPYEEEIADIEALIYDEKKRKENKIVAVGEIGFDYYWQPVNKELQYAYFDAQMSLAKKYDLPVIIHNRDAHGDTFDMICRHKDVRGVIHSCSMRAEMVKEIVKRGWYVSFSGTLTFKNADRVREACAAVPLDRLLIETDAPYLAPVPYRGMMNNSVYMRETALAAAAIHGLCYDEVANITFENAEKLFGL